VHQLSLTVGITYENGQGVKQDLKEAAKWYRKAADQRPAGAQFKLGDAYQFEQGAEQDFKEAVKCYQQAADQGHAQAQFRLNQLQPP
jgi:TPR repeat protein